MTPTYPKFKVSHIKDVKVTTMKMVNQREDVEWYEISMFDKLWNPIPFVLHSSYNKLLQMDYLEHRKFDVYINAEDSKRTEYICSTSKISKANSNKPSIESKICSRFK
tara:strand:- start:47 stop:370 length:324 start_codon:yes stop_codon:yes gene_type:complete